VSTSLTTRPTVVERHLPQELEFLSAYRSYCYLQPAHSADAAHDAASFPALIGHRLREFMRETEHGHTSLGLKGRKDLIANSEVGMPVMLAFGRTAECQEDGARFFESHGASLTFKPSFQVFEEVLSLPDLMIQAPKFGVQPDPRRKRFRMVSKAIGRHLRDPSNLRRTDL
jgi:hypothetical protein